MIWDKKRQEERKREQESEEERHLPVSAPVSEDEEPVESYGEYEIEMIG